MKLRVKKIKATKKYWDKKKRKIMGATTYIEQCDECNIKKRGNGGDDKNGGIKNEIMKR